MPIVNLYSNTLRGDIGFFGSALATSGFKVISPYTNVGGTIASTLPNTHGSVFNTWSIDTGGWSNWNPNPNIIPPDSVVEYAFLVWSSAYYLPVSPPWETAPPNVVLTKPDSTRISITPNSSYDLTYTAGWRQFTHGADVTAIMQDNQYGDYYLTEVPTGVYSTSNGCGTWGMYILYSHPSFKYRNVNLNVAATGFNTTVTITNLNMPVAGAVEAKVVISGVQGDRGYGDSLLLNGTKLFGPYNPVNDFMNSRMVDYTGQALQTKGALIVETGTYFGYYSDQTIITNNTILTNADTQAVITQSNGSDWAGVPFLGVLITQNAAELTPITKTVDKRFIILGDTITYTLKFKNSGSTSAINIVVRDTLPNGLTLVPNSLTVNSVSNPGDITSGITLPDLWIGSGYTITFSAKSTATNPESAYYNFGVVSYGFNPNITTIVNTVVESNIAATTIVHVEMTSSKQVDKAYAKVGDTLTYSIILKNTGNTCAKNIVIIDTIPSNTTFVANSLKQDGSVVSSSPNPPGATLPNNILPGGTSTITFNVIVNTIPSSNYVVNSASEKYIFVIDPSLQNTSSGSGNTNDVLTRINTAFLTNLTKDSSKAYTTVGDIITYTIKIPNTGNVTAANVVFVDTIPSGTTFINGSLSVDGVTIPGSPNPTGVNIGTIPAGGAITVSFKVSVDTIPSPNPIPNSATTTYNYTVDPSLPNGASGSGNSNINNVKVNTARVAMIKTRDLNYADIGTTITYTISLNNSGNVSAANVLFSDTIPNGTAFVNGSFSVNGTTIAGSPNPPGLNIGTIPVGISTVTFKVTVVTLPTPNPIPNSATTAYNYTIDPSIPNGGAGSANTNTVYTKVNHGQIASSKTVDKSYVTCSDILKFTVVITNTGNVSASNIVFQDTIPNGTAFINNSFTVNGVTVPGANPNTGVSIATIPSGGTSTLTFQVVVIC